MLTWGIASPLFCTVSNEKLGRGVGTSVEVGLAMCGVRLWPPIAGLVGGLWRYCRRGSPRYFKVRVWSTDSKGATLDDYWNKMILQLLQQSLTRGGHWMVAQYEAHLSCTLVYLVLHKVSLGCIVTCCYRTSPIAKRVCPCMRDWETLSSYYSFPSALYNWSQAIILHTLGTQKAFLLCLFYELLLLCNISDQKCLFSIRCNHRTDHVHLTVLRIT